MTPMPSSDKEAGSRRNEIGCSIWRRHPSGRLTSRTASDNSGSFVTCSLNGPKALSAGPVRCHKSALVVKCIDVPSAADGMMTGPLQGGALPDRCPGRRELRACGPGSLLWW